MKRNIYIGTILLLTLTILPAWFGMLQAQTIWLESFNYPDGTTTGINANTANPLIDWAADPCPTCVGGDWWEVRNNQMEAHDSNGPVTLTTETIDISAWPVGVEISVDLSKQGSMEGCPTGGGSGCNSTDYVRIEYDLDGAGFQDWTSPQGGSCNAPCAGDAYVTLGDFNDFSFNVCPISGNSIRLRISLQNWANDEYLRIDNIHVAVQTCNPFQNTATVTDVLCPGQSNGSISIASSGGQSPFTYSLNGAPFQSVSTFSFLPAGNYTVVIEDANGARDTLNGLTVSAPPPLALNLVATPAGCTSDIGSATVIASGGTPGYSYLWNTNPPQTGPSLTGLSSGTYTVTVTDANGCTTEDSIAVLPSAPLVLIADPDLQVCSSAGGAILGGSTAGGFPPFTWNWTCNTPICNLDSLTDDDPLANPSGNTTYYAQVSDSGGCISNIDSIQVTVLPSPAADAGTDTLICEGDSAQLQGIGSGVGPNYSFQWSPANSLNDATTQNPLASPASPTAYTLIVTSGGCPSLPDSVLVGFIAPTFADAGTDQVICQGDSVLLLASGTGLPGSNLSFWWMSGTDTLSTTDSLTIAPAFTGIYTLSVQSDPGCLSNPDSVVVFVEQPFTHLSPEPLVEFCPGEPIAIGVTQEPGYSYQWVPISGLQDPFESQTTVAPDESISYQLEIINDTMQSENCRSQFFSVNLLAGNCILPNVITPNGDGINDVLDFGPHFNAINLVIYDRWGREVFRANGYQNTWSGTNIAGQALPEGVYYYVLERNVVAGENRMGRVSGELTLLR